MDKHNPESWRNIRGGWNDLETLRDRVESAEAYIAALEAALWRVTHEALDLYGENSEQAVQNHIEFELQISAGQKEESCRD